MIDLFSPIYIGAGFAASCLAFGYFWDSGDKLRGEFRDKVRKKLKHTLLKDNLASLFISFFDCLFISNETGRPRLWRSVSASCLVLTIILCIWAFCWPERAESAFGSIFEPDPLAELYPAALDWPDWIAVVATGVGINLIGDIFSLWETRFVMGHMAEDRRPS